MTIDDLENEAEHENDSFPHTTGRASFSLLSAPPLPLNLPELNVIPAHSLDTIYQLSTGFQSPSGHTSVGVSILRLSGPLSLSAALLLCRLQRVPAARKAVRVALWEAREGGRMLDGPCLLLYFPAPHSFTGEDVVEFHTHGNPLIAQQVMAALAALSFPLTSAAVNVSSPPVRLREATAGEFTRRAFLNGRMDLLQVEALSDVLTARTEQQHVQAMHQLAGSLSAVYESWRRQLIGLLAHVEAVLDFSEDEPDVSADSVLHDITTRMQRLLDDMRAHVSDANKGELIREGVEVCIVGQVNVGKSSLLNALAGRDVSIVSPQAGTTRDVMEVALNVGGYAVRLVDTAGLRDSEDVVEQEGVRRAKRRAEEAQVRVVMFDANDTRLSDELLQTASLVDGRAIVVFSKVDILLPLAGSANAHEPAADDAEAARHKQLHNRSNSDASLHPAYDSEALQQHLHTTFAPLFATFKAPPLAVVPLSCRHHYNLSTLLAALTTSVRTLLSSPTADTGSTSQPLITRERHRQHIVDCVDELERCMIRLRADDLVLCAECLRGCVRSMARVVGRVDVEEVLDVIFADFCIGK